MEKIGKVSYPKKIIVWIHFFHLGLTMGIIYDDIIID
jgi:hypothetical protein